MLSWHSDCPATLEGNHPSAIDQTIGERKPEVRQLYRQAATAVYLTMTCIGELLRTATCENAVVTVKTSATSSTIEGISGQGRRPLHDVLQGEM
jgi:hypothetical protein